MRAMRENIEKIQEVIATLEQSTSVVLMTHEKPDGDGLACMGAMYYLLTHMGKKVTVFSLDEINPIYRFLPAMDKVTPFLPPGRHITITLPNQDKKQVDSIACEVMDHTLALHIDALAAPINVADIHITCENRDIDTVIVFDNGDMGHLGTASKQHPELFSATTVINIDHHKSNENYGQINWVDTTYVSTTSMIYDLIMAVDETILTPDVATLLLAGILNDTRNFFNMNTSPECLRLAAHLVEKGARQHELVDHLFKSKPLNVLKVWTDIMQSIEYYKPARLAVASVLQEDLKRHSQDANSAEGVMDEILVTIADSDVVLFMRETPEHTISASIRSKVADINVANFAESFHGGGHVLASGFRVKPETIDNKEFKELLLQTDPDQWFSLLKRYTVDSLITYLVNLQTQTGQHIVSNTPRPEPEKKLERVLLYTKE